MVFVADENIPLVEGLFGRYGEVRLLSGRDIDRHALADADVLLVRSVTNVGPALLDGVEVRFVGSATVGTDHIDQDYLKRRGIFFAHSPGSNADSVAEYVTAAMLFLSCGGQKSMAGRTLGVVGYGSIGRRVANRAVALGVRVLINDPLLERQGAQPQEAASFSPLHQLLGESDILTLHVPLERGGSFPTHHLLDRDKLNQLKQGALLINTSRGAVISSRDLLAALESGKEIDVALDVFEGEPLPEPDLIKRSALATPHIAGYSFDGKLRGVEMLYEAFAGYVGQPAGTSVQLPPIDEDEFPLSPPEARDYTCWLWGLVRQMYDICEDDRRMRESLVLSPPERAAQFMRLRKTYPARRSFSRFTLAGTAVPSHWRQAVTQGLKVRLHAT